MSTHDNDGGWFAKSRSDKYSGITFEGEKMSNTNTGNNGKEFNPTVTAMFDAPNFAKKALKEAGDTEGAAFLSAPIDDKAIAALDHIQIGSKLLLVKSAKPNKSGGATYYLEVLPPYQGRSATQQIEDGI